MKHIRLTSILLAISMLLLTIVPCIAFADNSSADVVMDTQYDLVRDLGIMNFADGTVTRGEFAKAVANLLTYDYDYRADENVYPFPDVIPSMDEYSAVKFLESLNIARGTGDGMFYAAQPVTLNEAYTFAVRALGFENIRRTMGSYTAVAAKCGLTKNISGKSANGLGKEDAVKLIYNMLMANIKNSELNFGSEYKYFYNYIGLELAEGKVTDDGVICLSGESNLKEDEIAIDGYKYVNQTDKTNLFGRGVSAYYKYVDRKYVIVSILLENDDVTVIDADDIKSYSDYCYTVTASGKSNKTYRLSKDFTLIYNGRPLKFDGSITEEKFNSLMKPDTGEVTLFKNNSSSYNVVRIASYVNMVVGNTAFLDNYNLFDKFAVSNSKGSSDNGLSIADDDNIRVKNANGNALKKTMVKNDDVVSYALSYDGSYVEIIVSNAIKNDELSYVGRDGIEIGGQKYDFSYEYEKKLNEGLAIMPDAGSTVKVYLNYKNQVVHISETGSDTLYAVFGDYKKENSLSASLQISMYTENANYIIFDINKGKLTVDGVKYSSDDKIIAALDRLGIRFDVSEKKYTVVRITSHTKDGRHILDKIDTPYYLGDFDPSNETADSLHYIKNLKSQSGRTYTYMNNSFSGYASINTSTRVFCVPANAADVSDTKMLSVTSNVFDYGIYNYDLSAYAVEENKMCADAVLLAGFTAGLDFRNYMYGGKTKIGIVTNINEAVNENGEKVNKIYVDDGATIKSYLTENTDVLNYSSWALKGDKVEVGDIVRFLVTDDVILNGGIITMYDYDRDEVVTAGSYDQGNNFVANYKYRLLAGYVNSMSNGYIEISQEPITGDIDYSVSNTFVIPAEAVPVMIYNSDRKVTELGTLQDVNVYKDDPGADCRVFAVINEMKPVVIMLYR